MHYRTLLAAALAVMTLTAAATPVAYELLTLEAAGSTPENQGPARLVVTQTQAELQTLYSDLFPGYDIPQVAWDRQIVVGFDFTAGACVPEVGQPTIDGQVVTIPLVEPPPGAACPALVVRPAFAVALDRTALPGGTVTVLILEGDFERVRGNVQLSGQQPPPDQLPATGLSSAWLTAAVFALAAGVVLVARSRAPRRSP